MSSTELFALLDRAQSGDDEAYRQVLTENAGLIWYSGGMYWNQIRESAEKRSSCWSRIRRTFCCYGTAYKQFGGTVEESDGNLRLEPSNL